MKTAGSLIQPRLSPDMLSILIPVYNYKVGNFVLGLKSQAEKTDVDFEIICLDDCSGDEFKAQNKLELKTVEKVVYQELPEKAGRAKIRNLLASMAKYPKLLFLDCDQQLQGQDFIKNYIKSSEKAPVVCGGRSYFKNPPADGTFFRWFYGSQREVSTAAQRSEKPYRSFLSCNFLIDKKTFLEIGFDESISEYGHEDTLFGMELKKRKIPILHIDNPVIHEGLEDAETFLKKSRQALKNLAMLYQKDNKELRQNVKILHWYGMAKKWGLLFPLWLLFKPSRKALEQNLLSENPSLKIFDFYKLGYFIGLMNTIERR